MFTENFFTKLLNLKDGWIVESVDTDLRKEEIYIQMVCLLDQIEDDQTGELCQVYDHAPERAWRHLDTMQYKTYIKCRLPRIKAADGKVKTVQPNWASGYERHTFLFEHAIIDLLKASKNQTKTAELMRCGFNVVIRTPFYKKKPLELPEAVFLLSQSGVAINQTFDSSKCSGVM